ncbi:MAG: hypothetical protein AAGI38_21540, partial [Bacteroidota bacterium]
LIALSMGFMGNLIFSQETTFSKKTFAQEILDYQPKKRAGVSENAYRKGTFFLSETRNATKGDPANLNVADYWNITMAFLKLDEPLDHVKIPFQLAIEEDPATICLYLQSMGNAGLDTLIPGVYLPFFEKQCTKVSEETTFDLEAYIDKHSLNAPLTRLMFAVNERDERFRKGAGETDWSKQTPLDKENQRIIDSVFKQHQAYIGKSTVGGKFDYVMFAVIQHSNQEMMERYLPVIVKARDTGELLQDTPLKLLLDRIYTIKYGYQIYGSQEGVDIAPQEVIEEVRKKYRLE